MARARGLGASGPAGPAPSSSRISSSAWPRHAAGSRRVLATDLDAVAHHPLDDRGHEHRDVGRSTGQPGDRVVTTRHEHPGGLGPLVALRDRFGVELAFVDVGDGEDDDRTMASLATRCEHRRGRSRSLSHVLWTTGAVLPIARIGAARAGARSRHHRSTRPRRSGRCRSVPTSSASTTMPCPPRSGCWDRRASARCGPRRRAASACRQQVGWFSFEPVLEGRRRGLAAERPAVRGDELPQAVGDRLRPEPRLALDVRSGCPGRSSGAGAWRGVGVRSAGPPCRASDADAAATGWRRSSPSGSRAGRRSGVRGAERPHLRDHPDGAGASTRSGSASAS